jgi:hypothetical protein
MEAWRTLRCVPVAASISAPHARTHPKEQRMKLLNLIKLLGIAGLLAAVAPSAKANIPVQWPDCNCDPIYKQLILGYNMDNMPTGVYSSIQPSYTSPLLNASNMQGPGPVKVTSGTNHWACFSGFPANGSAASIGFKLEYTSQQLAEFCGLTFNVASEVTSDGLLHGPTSFYVNVYSNGSQVWQSESVSLTPGFSNAILWDIGNPDGNNTNGDGFSYTGNDFSWRNLTAGDVLSFEIVASGANSSTTVGLDFDNVQVHACVVPEPGSALLLGSVSVLALMRRRRRAS